MDGGSPHRCGPDFSQTVDRDGYAWWYIDALSDDGRYGLTIIAFVGSVFSPYYRRARAKGSGSPANHVAVNVALYGVSDRRWTLTERGAASLTQNRDVLAIGRSSLRWDGGGLRIDIDEISVPVPRRVKGVVKLFPKAAAGRAFDLDDDGEHQWQPIAPIARVEVSFEQPALSWSGAGYFDHNRGRVPLETSFKCWDWSRTAGRDGTIIFYDVTPIGGPMRPLALKIDRSGEISKLSAPPRTNLPRSPVFRISRATRADAGAGARVAQTLEDTPFYARSIIETEINGSRVTAMHESLSLTRFASPIVQAMLPFRMPRKTV